jgi:hypothetical protein
LSLKLLFVHGAVGRAKKLVNGARV